MKTSKVDRVKGLPWLLLLQAAVVLGKRWSALSAKDRARLARLVRQSKGGPATSASGSASSCAG